MHIEKGCVREGDKRERGSLSPGAIRTGNCQEKSESTVSLTLRFLPQNFFLKVFLK